MIGTHSFQDSDASILIYPLRNRNNLTVQNGVIGTLAIDTASGQNNMTFERHQILFYQGIANIISDAMKRAHEAVLFAKVVQNAVKWFPLSGVKGVKVPRCRIVHVAHHNLAVDQRVLCHSSWRAGSSAGVCLAVQCEALFTLAAGTRPRRARRSCAPPPAWSTCSALSSRTR